jgi:hypothetical protein
MHHSVPEVLRICLAPFLPAGDVASNPIVLNYLRMLHGQIGGILFELGAGRVSSGPHYFVNQPVRLANCLLGFVHEMSLFSPPGFGKTIPLLSWKAADMEPFDPLFATLQLGFSFSPVAVLTDCTIVLRTEPSVQLLASTLLEVPESRPGERCNDNN